MIGHGQPGLRSGLRPFADFIDSSDTRKQILCELRGGFVPTDWFDAGSNSWLAYVSAHTLNDVYREVVGVRTALHPEGLARVETLAACQSTAGTFYFDPDQAPPTTGFVSWDDGVTLWDGGRSWDEGAGPAVYVHLDANADPNQQTVSVELGFYVASYAETHPHLGAELLTNGDFELWASATDAGTWTETATTGVSYGRESATVKSGTYSARLQVDSDWAANAQSAQYYVDVSGLVAGKVYRLCGDYRTAGITDGSTTRPYVIVGKTDDSAFVSADGRNTQADATALVLAATGEEWRRWVLDFVAPATSARVRLRLWKPDSGTTATSGASVLFDNVSLRRVWRFVTYDPALSSSSIPAATTGSNDIFFGGKRIGSGSITVDNSGGRFERVLGQLDWLNKEVYVRLGGRFADGQALTLDDYRLGFTGLTQALGVTDAEARFDFQDVRVFFHQKMPPNVYDDSEFPAMEAKAQGKPRALFFGQKENITPVRISKDASTLLGTYEIADCTVWTTGIYSLDAVYSYENEEAAKLLDTSRAVLSAYRPTLPTLTGNGGSIGGIGNHFKHTNSPSAWDAGAKATGAGDVFSGSANVIAEATHGSAQWMLGITSDNSTWGYSTLTYALYADPVAGIYKIFQGGSLTYSTTMVPEPGDVLQVRMIDGVVTYYVNGIHLYTSLVAPSGSTTYNLRVATYTLNGVVGGVRLRRETNGYHTADLATGRFTLAYDIGPYVVEDSKNRGVFYQSADKTFKVPPGVYSAEDLRVLLGAAFAVAGADVNYVGSYSNRVFTIANASVAFYPKPSSGAEKGIWPVLGFTGADRASGNTHAADKATFDDPERHFVLRVDAKGYKDDISGTYTGTASALIERGESITKFLFTRILGKPASLVDTASFTFAAGRATEALALYLDELTSTKDVFDRLEYSNVANIVVDGEGRIYYLVYIGDVPAGIVDFYDYDYLAFEAEQGVTDVYQTVKVLYDEDPTLGTFDGRASTDAGTLVRFGRPDYREFETYVKIGNAAQALADRLRELARRPPRKVKFAAKGKLIDRKVGDKIRLTRRRAFDAAGKLSGQVMRILSLSHDYRAGSSVAECVDDVVTVAGIACLTTCQSTCEFVCQTGCQQACQSTCEASCQNSCQASCQQVCELGCQSSCQLACQTGCQVACQTGCELSCQVCQGVCQTGCEVTCQYTCQLACQTGCQLACQSGCEVSCQTTCEVACQQACEVSCQSGCEVGCQDVCETSCQTACQTVCQTPTELLNY